MAKTLSKPLIRNAPDDSVDWQRVVYLMQLSRALDAMEEERLVPEKRCSTNFQRVAMTWRKFFWAAD